MIGVIADDLTGAAEIGAVGQRHGLRAEILLGPHFSRPSSAPRPILPDLLCLDTDSRFCSAAESARRAAAAARFLRRARVDFIYKKVDSVLRGQVVPELEGILGELGLKLALLVPANPSLGRTIRGGHYFIHGQPIHKTEFARDPAYPRKSSRVLKLLRKSRRVELQIGNVTETLPQAGIIVGNVATSAHIQQWSARRAPGILLAGGAEFFSSLVGDDVRILKSSASSSAFPKRPKRKRPARISKQILICGSTSQSAREFIAAQRQLGTPLFCLPPKLARGARLTGADAKQLAAAAAAALHSHPRILLHVGLPLIRQPSLAKKLSSYLVRVALLILTGARVDHVFVEGGATAVELVRAMHLRQLIVLDELAPGVATLGIASRSTPLLTMKPGSYRWPQSIEHFEATNRP
jgi:uncharacterized protein YgbK (DUF1537 family)